MQGAKGAELGLVLLIDAVAHRCNAVPGEGMVECALAYLVGVVEAGELDVRHHAPVLRALP